ncbi:sodium:calcium antiporter [Elusimicrobiota bacterium]
MVQGASEFARQWGVTETVIGILVVAVGTSLPEIAVVLAGSIKKVHGISLGTIVGSNIFNILLVAGGSAVISPIKLFPQEMLIQAPAVILMTVLLLPVIFTHKKITRGEGILLFVTYGMYVY